MNILPGGERYLGDEYLFEKMLSMPDSMQTIFESKKRFVNGIRPKGSVSFYQINYNNFKIVDAESPPSITDTSESITVSSTNNVSWPFRILFREQINWVSKAYIVELKTGIDIQDNYSPRGPAVRSSVTIDVEIQEIEYPQEMTRSKGPLYDIQYNRFQSLNVGRAWDFGLLDNDYVIKGSPLIEHVSKHHKNPAGVFEPYCKCFNACFYEKSVATAYADALKARIVPPQSSVL